MAKMQVRLCDIMLAQGKQVNATQKVTRTIPGALMEAVDPSNGRKAKKIELDVSDQGLRVLEQKDEKFKRLAGEAVDVYLDLVDDRDKGKKKLTGIEDNTKKKSEQVEEESAPVAEHSQPETVDFEQ